MTRRLLVTGSGGFVGCHLCVRARAAGWEVGTVTGDLTHEGIAEATVRGLVPDAVVHLAAPRRTVPRDPWETLRIELAMLARLMAAVGRHAPEAVVLGVGSAAQYGRGLPRPLGEEDPIAPVSPAGVVKTVLEAAFTAGPLRTGQRTIWCRAFNHAGPGQGPDSPIGSWARQLIAAERAGGGAVRTGTLAVVRDILDVRDVADAYLALLDAPEAAGVVNVCSGRAVSLEDVVGQLVAEARAPVAVDHDPALVRPGDPPYVVGDASRLRALTGWSPRIPLEQTLHDTVAELRAAPDLTPAGPAR